MLIVIDLIVIIIFYINTSLTLCGSFSVLIELAWTSTNV